MRLAAHFMGSCRLIGSTNYLENRKRGYWRLWVLAGLTCFLSLFVSLGVVGQ